MYSKNSIKKVVITGGAGYIGNELIKALPESIEIISIDNFHINTKHKRIENKKLQKSRKLKLIEANTSECKKYEKHLKNVDAVIYMASLNSYQESNENPFLYITENNINLQIFLDALKRQSPKVKKFIVTSTRGIYGEGPYMCTFCKARFSPALAESIVCTECGSKKVKPLDIKESDLPNPTSFYGLTKKNQEDILSLYCAENNAMLDVIRIFNVFGEDQGKYYSNIGILPRMLAQIESKGEIYMVGNGDLARDFVYVGDVVKVLTRSIFGLNKRTKIKEVYNLGSGKSTTIKDMAKFFEDKGYKFKKNKIKQYNDIKYSVADNSKVSKAFKLEKFLDMSEFMKRTYGATQK